LTNASFIAMRFRAFAAALTTIGLLAAVSHPVIKDIIIAGDPLFPAPILLAHLTIRPGMRYSDTVREKDFKTLSNFYKAHHLTLALFEGGLIPSSIDAKSDTAMLKYFIFAARVAAVRIVGNTSLSDAAIRKLLQVRPGMILDSNLVKADERRLRATGDFLKVTSKIERGPDPTKPQDVTLVWILQSAFAGRRHVERSVR
jgi:outer membrane protein assembly factor BamA